MFYNFLVPEGGHPTWEENCFENKISKYKVLFISNTSKLKKCSKHIPVY